jgi:tRNA modification GTPase
VLLVKDCTEDDPDLGTDPSLILRGQTPPVSCGDSPLSRVPVIIIWNKTDLAGNRPSAFRTADGVHVLPLSAKTGEGLPELLRAISAPLLGEQPSEHAAYGPAPGTERQRALIDRAAASIRETLALATASPQTPPALDLAAPALRDAVDALGEITGEVTTDAILTTMFSRFCVGK